GVGDVGGVLGAAAAGSFGRGGGQVDLEGGVGGHDGTDVAAFDHDAAGAAGDDRALLGDQGGTHGRYSRNSRDRGGHLGPADEAGHVGAVDGDGRGGGIGTDADADLAEHLEHGVGVGRVDAAAQDGPGQGPVHRARVDVG